MLSDVLFIYGATEKKGGVDLNNIHPLLYKTVIFCPISMFQSKIVPTYLYTISNDSILQCTPIEHNLQYPVSLESTEGERR